ncbi:Peptidase M23 [Spirosoma linguale DSM 74]|uniref:Peptidase M23 n=2 Tax=Spirosoma TaxID=107 RepID=D2QE31_SPILD|nr:Peptidase M23 [Spirosoma linguale DSM 74]
MIPIPVNKLFKGMAYRIDSWFGPRNTGLAYASKFHKGLDINFGGGRADYGAPVLGTHDGVASVKDNLKGNEGRMVTLTSPDGKFRTKYLHLSSINVEDGQKITEMTQVGEIGGSRIGKEFGGQVHLHYQIERLNEESGKFEPYNPTEGKDRKESNVVDPQSWIQKKEDTFQMSQLSTMDADATRVELNQFFDSLKNMKTGIYKVVNGKIILN